MQSCLKLYVEDTGFNHANFVPQRLKFSSQFRVAEFGSRNRNMAEIWQVRVVLNAKLLCHEAFMLKACTLTKKGAVILIQLKLSLFPKLVLADSVRCCLIIQAVFSNFSVNWGFVMFICC